MQNIISIKYQRSILFFSINKPNGHATFYHIMLHPLQLYVVTFNLVF